MSTLGIVGGIAPESTIEYYRSIVKSYREQQADGSYPSIVINSIDLTGMLRLVGSGELAALTRLLVGAVEQLARAGADFALMASNTPHLVYAEVARAAPIPMISIVEEACRAAAARGMRRLGLFGTRFTMQASFYRDAFGAAAMTVIAPAPDEQELIHDKYMSELVPGTFLPETRAKLVAIVDAMRVREGIDGLILGGTELPLLLGEPSYGGVTVLDTTRVHVESAVARMVGA
jgi:aspartate racemase